LFSNIGTKRNSLTQQFIGISTTIDIWATCFDSYWVIFRPSKNTDPISKVVKCNVGSRSAQFIGISTTIDTWATCFDSYWVILRPSKNYIFSILNLFIYLFICFSLLTLMRIY